MPEMSCVFVGRHWIRCYNSGKDPILVITEDKIYARPEVIETLSRMEKAQLKEQIKARLNEAITSYQQRLPGYIEIALSNNGV